MKFEGCTAVKCSRLSVGPKQYYQYQIKEECNYFKLGLCPYPDRVKIERKQDGILEPAGT